MRMPLVIGLLIALAAVAPTRGETPLTTGFTYQGQLKEGGVPFEGAADFEFTLWDDAGSGNPPTGGTPVGGVQLINALPVTAGLFTVTLNAGGEFGANAFKGNARWLQIAVRSPAGSGGFTTLAPRQPLTATPYALQSRGIFVDDAGNVGIGSTNTNQAKLIVESVGVSALCRSGDSGWGNFGAPAGVWGDATSGNGVLATNDAGTGLAAVSRSGVGVFGYSQSNDAIQGYTTAANKSAVWGNHEGTSEGYGVLGSAQGDNITGQVAGVHGISTGSNAYGVYGVGSGFRSRGVYGVSSGIDSAGVFGENNAALYAIGVLGHTSNPDGDGVYGSIESGGFGYAVYAAGRIGATGTKSFRIDHPDDPENKYLLHYSTESPEVLNTYRGMVALDGAGEAVVELPHYFAKINKTPSYQLTAVGAPMPMLHVAEEIDEAALSAGATAGAGVAAPACSFRIAGGAPRAKVSWEVKAVRNDLWCRNRAEPVEVEKRGREKGTYQHPELYGLSAEMGRNYHGEHERPSTAPAERGLDHRLDTERPSSPETLDKALTP